MYKIGDRVICVEIGEFGVVVDIDTWDEGLPYEVEFDNGDTEWTEWVGAEDLTLVSSQIR